MPERLAAIKKWIEQGLGFGPVELTAASSDASFRRYFRVHGRETTWIVMDAPPGKEDVEPFIRIAAMMGKIGLNVPRVLELNRDEGFLLLTDLGDESYLEALADRHMADQLYADAIQALILLQRDGRPEVLPDYDQQLLTFEMSLFRDWYLGRHLGLDLDAESIVALEPVFSFLSAAALEQPRVCVHRDYHSRNLMVCDHNPGILDFQDAVVGPITYDLISLLRDCYIVWPQERILNWVRAYRRLASQATIAVGDSETEFLRWFDLMSVQRHLKATGIFARLNYRDGKPLYLADIPRTLSYVRQVAPLYTELTPLETILEKDVWPRIEKELAAS